jgi:hypothetical protein
MSKNYRDYKPFAPTGDHMYNYPETRGYMTKAIPKWITQNVLNLLPTKARTLDLLRSMGAIETGLSGWPIMRELESVFLEGFFKVNDLWEDVDNVPENSGTQSVDLVTMGMRLRQKPEITYEYWKRAYYHYSMFGMRFAFNEWDRKVLGSNFNKYMNDILKRRIDSYSMALNRLLWEHHLRGRTDASNRIIASYLNDAKGYASNASMQDVGSIPYYLNGLGFRIGFATSKTSFSSNFPYDDSETGHLHRIAAVTYHDGSYYRPDNPLHYTISAPNNTHAQWGVSGTGTVSRLVFSSLPFFWFPDAPGTPLFNGASSVNLWFLRPPASGDVYTIDGANYLYSESLLKLHRQVVGALIRGYHINYSTGDPTRARLRTDYLNSFFGTGSFVSTLPSEAVFDYGLGTIETYATTAPFLWTLPEPFQFSPAIGQYLQSFVSTNPNAAFQHNHWSRMLAVIRATRQPTIISARQTVSNTTFYPIYFGEYGIQTTGNPWAHAGFLSGADTRFSLKPTVLERLHSYMQNNGAEGQKILACHPNVAIALNLYAMSNIEWNAMNKRSYGPVDFRAEFPRYGDFVIYTDLMIPDGVIHVIVPSEKSLSFAFDANDFKLKEAATKNAVNLYMGFFIMRLLMSSAHQHGMIWGVKPDTLADV